MLFLVTSILFTVIPEKSLFIENESFAKLHQMNKHVNPLVVRRHRTQRDISVFSEDEVGWSNINEEVDMALMKIWPHMVERGYTTLILPDLTESISVRPLFITYAAELRLTNGYIYNMEGLERAGDAYMTYSNKYFQFKLNLNIRNMLLAYDFALSLMGISGGGKIEGFLKDTFVSGNFSVSGEGGNLQLNDFHVISFGNLGVSLKSNMIIQQISGSILTPITRLFEDHIADSISETLMNQLRTLMGDINKMDHLGLKMLVNSTFSRLTG